MDDVQRLELRVVRLESAVATLKEALVELSSQLHREQEANRG